MNASFYVPRLTLALVFAGFLSQASAQYGDWKHSGSMYLVTDSAGADLPASAVEKNFPLLVRLNKEYFDFSQAKPSGRGHPIFPPRANHWLTRSNAGMQREPRPTSGCESRPSRAMISRRSRCIGAMKKVSGASDGEQVFRTTEGFAGVWHLGDNLEDATSNNLDGVNRPDKPTSQYYGHNR